MALFSSTLVTIALQGASVPPVQPPPDKVRCILAIGAVGDDPAMPFTAFNYYESGYLRIEREMRLGGATRNVKDLIVQMDNSWYAMGAAEIVEAPSTDPAMGGAMMPVLRIPMVAAFALALPTGRSLTIWDNEGRREQFNLTNFDAETIAEWRTCIRQATPPTVASDIGYRVQLAFQEVTPLNKNRWISIDDYPSRAVREERSGTVAYKLTVNVNGRVANCEMDSDPAAANGTIVNDQPDLNDATCRNIQRRARFKPATDQVGRPFASTYKGRVRWVLPE